MEPEKYVYHTLNGKIESEKPLRRQFGGKLNGFENNKEANFEKAHLKAYLKGHKFYHHGIMRTVTGERKPILRAVQENWIPA